MPVNRYFNNFPSQNRFNNESKLMEDVIAESIQIMGHDVYYILRESIDSPDMVFGESTKVKFQHAYLIEAYITNVEGFEGDGDFFSKFGLEIRDSSNFVLSRRSFAKIVPTALRIRPQEGDIVYVPLMHRMFEIKFIEKKLMFFSLGNREPYVYEMRCEDFRYSQEQLDTGIQDVDAVERENAYTENLSLDLMSGSGNYPVDDTVYQSPDGTWANNTAHASVEKWFAGNGTLLIFNVSGTFQNTNIVYSNTSNTHYAMTSIDDISDFGKYYTSDNVYLQEEAGLILDLTELNPFGTP